MTFTNKIIIILSLVCRFTIGFNTRRHDSEKKIEEMRDILLTVKTTAKNHKTRVKLLLDVWAPEALEKTFLVTDKVPGDDFNLLQKLPGRVIQSYCDDSHSREDLSCKMNFELSILKNAIKNNQPPKWYCHFDDDTFLNFEALQNHLSSYPEDEPIYTGKKSISKPVQITYRSNDGTNIQSKPFHFATGGAGWCINRPMYQRLITLLSHDSDFTRISRTTGLPDDMTIGFLIESELGEQLKSVEKFHSHLEDLDQLKNPSDQITLSYAPEVFDEEPEVNGSRINTIQLPVNVHASRSDRTKLIALSHSIGQKI